MRKIILAAVLAAASFFGVTAAHACNVPNPNLTAPPFVDGCPVPASALNALANLAGTTVHPEAYGAVGNGIVDDTIALRTALTAAATSKLPLWLTPGKTYLTSSEIVISSPVVVLGSYTTAGNDVTNCPLGGIENFSNTNILTLTGDGSRVEFICIIAGTNANPATAGVALTVGAPTAGNATQQYTVGNQINFPYTGIGIGGATGNNGGNTNSPHVTDNWVVNPRFQGIAVGQNSNSASTTSLLFERNRTTCSSVITGTYGFALYDVAIDDYFGNESTNCEYGLAIIPGGASAPARQFALGFLEGVMGDTNTVSNLLINATTAYGDIQYLTFDNWWAGVNTNTTGAGILIEDTGASGLVRNISFTGGTVHGSTSANTCLFDLENDVSGITIVGNHVGPDAAENSGTGLCDNTSGVGVIFNSNNFTPNNGSAFLAKGIALGSTVTGITVTGNDFNGLIAGTQITSSAVTTAPLNISGNYPLDAQNPTLTDGATLPAANYLGYSHFYVTGTGTNITNMTGCWAGRSVELIPITSGGITFATGGTSGSKFNASLTVAQYVPAFAYCDGVTWYLK